jgi:hypothetical protein
MTRGRWRLGAWIVACAFLWLGASPREAGAQEPEPDPAAAQFFRAGLAAYARHEYRAAALAFEEADRRAPRAAAMYNAARAWQAGGDPARAADAYAAALRGANLAADEAALAEKGLRSLEPALGKVEVTGPSTANLFFDESERGPIPRTVHANPGAHDVRVRKKDGADLTRHVIVIAGQTETIAVPDDVAPMPGPGLVEPKVALVSRLPAESAHRTLFRPWGFVAFGGAAALALAGGVTYFGFTQERSSFDAGGDRDGTLHTAAETYRATTYVLWSAAAACGVAGVVLAFVPRGGESGSTGVLLGPGLAAVRGSF